MKVINYFKRNWLMLFIIMQPLLDVLSYFQAKNIGSSFTWIIRILCLVLIGLYSFYKSKDKKQLILYCLPFILFYIIHILNLYRIGNLSIFQDTRYFVTVFQMPILTIMLIDLYKNKLIDINQIKKGVIISFLIIFFSLVLSYITDSYEHTYRTIYGNLYGLSGWASSANTHAMILAILCPLYLYVIIEKKSLILNILSFCMVFVTLYFNGTKSCYLALISIGIVFSYIFLTNIKKNKINKFSLLISLLFLCLSILLYEDSATYRRANDKKDNIYKTENQIKDNASSSTTTKPSTDSENDLTLTKPNNSNVKPSENKSNNSSTSTLENKKINKNSTYEIICEESFCANSDFLILKSSYLYRKLMLIHSPKLVYEELKGMINYETISDNRLVKKTNAKIYFNNSDSITRLFGIGYSIVEKDNLNLENDLSAIFYYYGYFGLVLYLSFVINFIILILITRKLDLKIIYDKNLILLTFIICLAIVGGEYSGAFLRKPNASIYLTLTLILCFENINTNKKNKSKKSN